MFRKAAALAAFALLAGAAAPAPKAAAAFDARDPASLVALLGDAGAKAKVDRKVEDTVLVGVTSTAADFSVQFVGCNPQGRGCQAALYDSGPLQATPTLAQINGFNQSSALCRAWQDKGGKPHVVYSTLMFADATRDQVVTQLAAWQGCLSAFAAFAKDPVTYLAEAP